MKHFLQKSHILLSALTFCISISIPIDHVSAQSLPIVPSEMTFAGVSIYLSKEARLQVQQEVRLLYANRKQLEQDMDALYELVPLWQPFLQNAGLPADFRYVALPFANTGNPAYWSVQAKQIPATGLRVNQAVDETRHPLIATEKVSSFLKELRDKYRENAAQVLLRYLRDGTLTTGTSSGKTQAKSVWLDIDSPSLLWKILARKIMIEQQEPAYRPLVKYILYTYYGGGQTLSAIAQQLRIPDDRFYPYNAWLRTPVTPFEPSYPILVRLTDDEFSTVWSASNGSDRAADASLVGKIDLGFPLLLKSSVRADGLRAPATFYTINERRGVQAKSCDNPITLAFYGNITPEAFLTYNDMTSQDVVRPGQIYYLQRKAKRAQIPFHIMQRNQSLRDIANIYGMRLSSLLRFNRIKAAKRSGTGRILWLRKKRPRSQPVEYQQLPPEPAPLMPLPTPTLAFTDSSAIPATTRPEDSLTLTQLTVKQPDTITVEPNIVPKKSVEIVKQADTLRPAAAPLPTGQKTVVVKPVDTALVPPAPAATSKESTKKTKVTARTHVVKPGQTYYAIAHLYGVTLNQLYSWNNLSETTPLEIGQELIVSPTHKSVPRNPATVREPESVVYYVVQPGQTVYRIALINKTTVDNVMKWNSLKDYTIEVGQKLIVRKPE